MTRGGLTPDRYHRRRMRAILKFHNYVDRLARHGADIPEPADVLDYFASKLQTPEHLRTPPLKPRHRAWILAQPVPVAALELYRIAFHQHAPSEPWS